MEVIAVAAAVVGAVGSYQSGVAQRSQYNLIDPFSGSPDIVRAANETVAGREYGRLLADADAALRGGQFQAQLYEQAGQTAYQQGIFSAVGKLGMAAAQVSGSSSGKQSPAPIESREAGLPRYQR